MLAVAGSATAMAVEALGRAPNVRGVSVDPRGQPLDRAVEAWAAATRTHVPYLVHDADPLASVAEAWGEWFDGRGVRGDLEVAVQATVARWRAGTLELPDYYLVIDPEALHPSRRDWYLGFLASAAPTRVVPVASSAHELDDAVRALRAGRWWPDLDRLLRDVATVLPDRLAAPVHQDGPKLATVERPRDVGDARRG